MRDQCTIAAFDGCQCEEGQCKSKAIPLGRFEKRIPMPYPKTHYLSGAVALLAVWTGVYASLSGVFQ